MAGSTLPERVAQSYYTYGLFCSSYPATAITLALSFVLICCYPLLNVPLPGNIPTVVNLPLNYEKDKPTTEPTCFGSKCLNASTSEVDLLFNETQKLPYIWVKDKPLLYVQQIILKIGVSPWSNNLKMWDAFRAPLQEVFRLLEIIRNHEDTETGVELLQNILSAQNLFSLKGMDLAQFIYSYQLTLEMHVEQMAEAYDECIADVKTFTLFSLECPCICVKSTLIQHCYQVGGIKRSDIELSADRVMPEYSCLLLSPANLWQQNLQTFSLDANIVNTIHNYQNIRKGKASIAEMAFGMQLRDSGIKRYPLRARPRVLQYAVTIFYERYDYSDERFIQTLNDKLRSLYPLYQDTPYMHVDDVTLIYYPGQFNYRELVPLTITFIGLFLYVYFSVRKIEFIKSKCGLAACAVLSVAGSLSMSMGICYYFGFSLSNQGKEIFPYLVIIVGLENILVLTKSVTSTDTRLDVKIRLAQGLSKEGWSITKNLLTEITIFTVSLFTFVPFIQEFSIFMTVSLISDYFIQMVFFATILGIDVHHMEHVQDKNKLHLKDYFIANNVLNWRSSKNHMDENSFSPQKMTKSKSHPRLNGLVHNSPTDVIAKINSSPGHQDHRVPKRIRLVNMWARTRFFQRAFMLWMIVWLSMIVYNSGVVDYFISTEKLENNADGYKRYNEQKEAKTSLYEIFYNNSENNPLVFPPMLNMESEKFEITNETVMLKYSPNARPWSRLSAYHWSAILSHYNVTVAGRYAVILPPVLLSHRVSPELAVGVRNPEERDPPRLRWQALAAALDPIDIASDFEIIEGKAQPHQWGQGSDLPIYPTTPMEILLLTILCTISVAVIAYMMVVLYRCVCSRHYAEWRASWNNDEEYKKIISKQPAIQLVMEAVPLVVAGHSQEVECIVTDGEKVVSSCLQGNIKVWDSENGEIITNIDRNAFFKLQKELYEKVKMKKVNTQNTHETEGSNSIEGTPKSAESVPRLRKGLSGYLSGLRFRATSRNSPSHLSAAETTKYDFAKNYRQLYCSNQNDSTHDSDAKENSSSAKDCDVSDNDIFVFNSDVESVSDMSDKSKTCDNRQLKTEECDSSVTVDNLDWKGKAISESPVWCMDFCNDLIIIGCADGRLEFWEASSGKLMCVWWCVRGHAPGVTHVRALAGARRVCAATLSGHLTLLRLDAYNITSGAHLDWRFCTAHKRTHKRTGSAGSLGTGYGQAENSTRHRFGYSYTNDGSDGEEVVCVRLAQSRPHQQPITELHSEGGRVVTGGQDHVLKVFSSADLSPLFTLHGHCGPITSCFIDHATPIIGGSGSQDGLLCVWDLHTGACVYSMQAHDGAVTSLAYTASYVVSAGSDERLCIWDRFQGHMLNTIHIGLNYMSRMLPLTHTLLVMGDRSGLTAYDLSSGDIIRRVLLGQSDGCIFVRQILPLKDAIVCDYANQLRIVRFPLVSRLSNMKSD